MLLASKPIEMAKLANKIMMFFLSIRCNVVVQGVTEVGGKATKL